MTKELSDLFQATPAVVEASGFESDKRSIDKSLVSVAMYSMPSENPCTDFDPSEEFFFHNEQTYQFVKHDFQLVSDRNTYSPSKNKKSLFFDMDNCLYPESSGIQNCVKERILAFCANVHNMSKEEATFLGNKYLTDYGLSIRGLLLHHPGTDPSHYDQFVDGGIDIEKLLLNHSSSRIRELFERLKISGNEHIWIFTNAGASHALRTLGFLFGVSLKSYSPELPLIKYFDGVIYCDYKKPDFICKPHRRVFQMAEQVADVSEDNVSVLLDDSIVNIFASISAGWKAVLVSEFASGEQVFLENDGKYMSFINIDPKSVQMKNNYFIVIRTIYDIEQVIDFV